MKYRRKPREKDLTDRLLSGELDDELEAQQRFSARSKHAQANKILQTALLRAEEQSDVDIEALPIGDVVQVYSLFSEVESGGRTFLCVVRKTLTKLAETSMLVGDRVRIRDLGLLDEQGRPQGVIEQVLPRATILTRTDSFKGQEEHPIVANANQMLIVASLREPAVKWGLIDRMIVAAEGGKLRPIICLNKIDLARDSSELQETDGVLSHYTTLGITVIRASVPQLVGIDALREVLAHQTTVLAGHSGVGKSTLVNAMQPSLDLKTGQISGYTGKGRHTTTGARRYPLEIGGFVIDTPGVKLFGLWGVTRENLDEFFPDVASGTAPPWRQQSYQRIAESLQSGRN